MGAYAAGAGYFNVQTAEARSINATTAMRYNQYMYESEMEARKQHAALLAKDQAEGNRAYDQIHERILNNPTRHDIYMGDALNAAVEEIEDPRAYSRNLSKANVPIGGAMIRDIPFRYAPAGITMSIHQITQNPPPAPLMTADFDEDRAAFKGLGQEIRKDLQAGEKPNPETVKKALAVINAAEAKADKILPRNTKDRNDVDKYLKSLHGLIGMLATPSLEILLAGVEKHPEATLGDLLAFMSAYNLRFGQATTEPQRAVYDVLFPKLMDLRTEVQPALTGAPPPRASGNAVGEFFSGMDYQDLQKKAPAPPRPGGGQR